MSVRSDLFIDRLSLTLRIDSSEHCAVKGNLDGLVADGLLVQEQDRFSEFLKSYRYAYRLMFGEGYFCAIQIFPHKRGARFMRLEWNPNKAERVCSNAMERIARVLARCIPSYSAAVLLDANFTRIDLTFDLRGIPVDSFFVNAALRKNYSSQYTQLHEKFGVSGQLNAREIGRPESDQYLLIYDKSLHAEIQQIRMNPSFAINSIRGAWPRRIRLSQTRFELRVRRVGSYEQLFNLPNPFARYTVVSRINAGGIKSDHHWKFFMAACEKFGAQAALSMIENRRERKRYLDAMRVAAPPAWWNPSEIWGELPNAIYRALGIAR